MASMFADAEIRVGKEYQVDIPPLQGGSSSASSTPRSGSRSSKYRQRWTPRRFSEAQVMEFLHQFCRLNEIELGLECLNDSNFQVDKAVVLLHEARRKRIRHQQEIDDKITPQAFEQMIHKHGKVFENVKDGFVNTSTREVVEYFFHWKKSAQASKWNQRAKSKKKKDKLRALARLRYGAEQQLAGTNTEDGADSDVSDYHNSYCEMCFTCGQLLCCDGCERAYHLSCVTPPMKEVPQGDWYCPACQSLLDSKQIDRHKNGNWMAKPKFMSQGEASILEIDHSDDDDDDTEEKSDEVENSPRSERTMSFESIENGVEGKDEDKVETNGSHTSDSSSDSCEETTPKKRIHRTRTSPLALEPSQPTRKNSNSKISKSPGVSKENLDASKKVFTSTSSTSISHTKKKSREINGPAPLAFEPVKNRKRHRKIEAPRRIPQSVLPSLIGS